MKKKGYISLGYVDLINLKCGVVLFTGVFVDRNWSFFYFSLSISTTSTYSVPFYYDSYCEKKKTCFNSVRKTTNLYKAFRGISCKRETERVWVWAYPAANAEYLWTVYLPTR